MTGLVAQLTELRRRFPQLRPRHWLQGRREDGSFDILWLTPAATEMQEPDWNFPEGRFLSYVLGASDPDQQPLFVVLNAAPETIEFTFPTLPELSRWTRLLDTTKETQEQTDFSAGSKLNAPANSVLAFAGTA
jgi:glycogen operon protein